MQHPGQKFLTIFLVLAAVWLLVALEPAVGALTGARCEKTGSPPLQLSNCAKLVPSAGPLPQGIEMIATAIAAGGLILAAVASFEIARKRRKPKPS